MLNAWTGRSACALQSAFRFSNQGFAQKLGISLRTVGTWHEKPDLQPQSGVQQLLDALLESAPPAVKERFTQLTGTADVAATPEPQLSPAIKHRLDNDLHIRAALEWLDHCSDQPSGTNRRAVAEHVASLDLHEVQASARRRARVDQHAIAAALSAYYSDRPPDLGLYQARYGPQLSATTSILTQPNWLDLACSLGTRSDALDFSATAAPEPVLTPEQAEHAVQRLATVLATNGRLTNLPLYRLTSAEMRKGTVAGTLGVVPFVEYALTMDLLETELTSTIAAGQTPEPGTLPLRDSYLPNAASVVDLSNRLCAGGALALCAIARPARPFHTEADYVLLIQERSSQVLNAAHRLAVIPKGFHQPMADYRADSRIGATLLREMEEELFGREDIDNTLVEQRSVDPMHPSRLSEPMRWLLAEPGRFRMECTAFGLNLVSGNYEFPGLLIIDDEDFWTTFGGQIEANWESQGLRQYSSLDRPLITELIGDVGWSNEGLFALLQGLRRLEQIGGSRVDLPAVEWEIT
jgi:hypothetical protein